MLRPKALEVEDPRHVNLAGIVLVSVDVVAFPLYISWSDLWIYGAARWDFLHLGYYDDDCSLAPLEGERKHWSFQWKWNLPSSSPRRCQQSLPVSAQPGSLGRSQGWSSKLMWPVVSVADPEGSTVSFIMTSKTSPSDCTTAMTGWKEFDDLVFFLCFFPTTLWRHTIDIRTHILYEYIIYT